jgi:regulator of sigma E protease
MTAGVIFNFLLALIIYSMVLFYWGDSYIPLAKATYGMEFSDTFHNLGFKDGDILLKADENPLERMNEVTFRKVIEAKTVSISRNGVDTLIHIPSDIMQRMLKEKKGFANFRLPVEVEKVMSESARQAGLQTNDKIVCISGIPTPVYEEMVNALYVSKGKTVPVEVERNREIIELNMPIDTLGKIGITMKSARQIYEAIQVQVKYNFWESFPEGIKLGINTLKGYVSDMKYVFTKEGAKSVGGFGAIGNMFPSVWNWQLFWERTAFLSIILAFMNILPIPALDGGHVLFLLVEVVTGRKPSDKFLERAQIVGMMILFGILIYANGNDLFRLFMN